MNPRGLKPYTERPNVDNILGSSLPAMPIIVGAPRSGTTLLRFMLDAHSDLAIPPETGFLPLSEKLRVKGDKLRKKFFESVVNHPLAQPCWPDFEIPKETFWRALSEITPFSVTEGFRAFYRLYANRHGKTRWGDKTPIYCQHLNTIRKVLPEARFIHIIRDGRDVSLSLRQMWFSPGPDIETQAKYWADCVRSARSAGVGHDDYIEVRYEELVVNTKATLMNVCAHIDLDFQEAMLNYHVRVPERLREHKGRVSSNGTVLVTQAQRWAQQKLTTQPPKHDRTLVWKRAMSPDEVKRFEIVAGGLLEELGYETSW
jgi:hypothetical protein